MTQMEFTYQDFLDNYAAEDNWLPKGPLEPWTCIDQGVFPTDDVTVDKLVKDTKIAFTNRLGGAYYEKFDRARTLSLGFGGKMFPAYQFLFYDIACEDWLSLVDFHKDFRRDHSVHQPLTAYIVSKLLGRGNPNDGFLIGGESLLNKALDAIIGEPDSQYLRDRLAIYDNNSPLLQGNRELWRQVFYQTAIITAMYHDLGYPWQFIEQMHETLKDDILFLGRLRYNAKDANVINPIVSAYIDDHQEELMFRPFYHYGKVGQTPANINRKVFEAYLHTSHGVPGALAFWIYNDAYRTTEGVPTAGLIKFCQEWSCLAILMHDMQKAYKQAGSGFARLDFKTDPLSFIIALADTLEDFNRPNAIITPTATGNGCEITYSFPSLAVVLLEDNGEAEICYTVVEEKKGEQEYYKSKDQKNLFDQPNGYFDLSSIGLKSLTIKCK